MGVWKTVAAFQWLGASGAAGAAEILDPGLEKHHLTAAFFPRGKVLVKQMPSSFLCLTTSLQIMRFFAKNLNSYVNF